jgi:hypothetical protein
MTMSDTEKSSDSLTAPPTESSSDDLEQDFECCGKNGSASSLPSRQYKSSNPQLIRSNNKTNKKNDHSIVNRSNSFRINDDILPSPRNWNEEMMSLFDRVYTRNDINEKCQLIHQLLNLVKEFQVTIFFFQLKCLVEMKCSLTGNFPSFTEQDFAVSEAKKIIDEIGLPVEQKSIKPVNLGGFAGGQKGHFHLTFYSSDSITFPYSFQFSFPHFF